MGNIISNYVNSFISGVVCICVLWFFISSFFANVGQFITNNIFGPVGGFFSGIFHQEYGRGAGYPWRFGDGLNNDGSLARCAADNPDTGCEVSGAVAYPKCKTGYSASGCCLCRKN